MSAQLYNGDSAAVPKPGPPQGDGAMMVNGTAAEGQGTDTSGVGGLGSLGNPNLLDTMQLGDRPGPLPASGLTTTPPPQVDPPYGNPDMGANVLTTTVTRAEQTRDMPAPSTPSSSTFREQEFFTSQSSPGNESQGIRWMTRFSEFLRTTATRGVHWMDGLGMQVMPGQSGNVGQATATGAYQMNVSPPEEMPPRPTQVPAIPGSWAVASPQREAPLFGPAQVAQLRRAQQEHPLLYGVPQIAGQGSEGDSERSSRLQAEVQRQLEEYQSRQQLEMERLQREIVRLREERDIERRMRQGQSGGDLPQGQNVPEGNQGPLPGVQGLPQSQNVPEGNHGPLPVHATLHGSLGVPQSQNVPEGNHGPLPVQASHGSFRNPQSHDVPGGNHGPLPSSLMPPRSYAGQGASGLEQNGGRVSENQIQHNGKAISSKPPTGPMANGCGFEGAVPKQGDAYRQFGVPGVFYGQLPPPQSQNVPGGNHGPLPQSQNVPGGNHGPLPQSQNVPGGNHGPLPQSQNVPGGNHGPLPTSQNVPGGNLGVLPEGHGHETRTGQQWLSESDPQDKMALLADGITQLQAAMLKQYDKTKDGERSPSENIKPGTSVLPLLKDVAADTACVDIMDWMELIDAPMSDLSDGSASWWRRVVKEAYRTYGLWTLASPVERLTIVPEVGDLESGQWSRVNSRAASMIVMALPDGVKSEVVARRQATSTTKLLYRLLQLYQPGGEDEKVKILGHLQAPPPEQDPHKAVQGLRNWNRWLRRCRELHLQTPDPSLLTRGLNGLVKQVLEKNQEVMFRTSLLRSNLKVDTNPSYESVEGYYRHLMGEMEALAVGSTPSSTTTSTPTAKQEPRLRPFKGEPKGGPPGAAPPKAGGSSPGSTTSGAEHKYDKPKSEVPCKFFGRVARGCARGSKCPFMHSWDGLDKKDKCLLCGGKGHMQKECPSRKGTPPGSLGGTPKSGSEKPVQASSSSSTTTTKAVRIDEVPEVNEIAERGSAEPSISSNDLRDVLADVGRVLKSMTATTLKKMEVKVKEAVATADNLLCGAAPRLEGGEEGSTGLLDTGASHAMRTATRAEYTDATPVKVTLAGEDEKILRQNDRGTILVQEEEGRVQPIVPLGALIEGLGYTLHWSPTKLKLTHPEKGSVRVRVNNHCPEVAACDALAVIRELEMKQVNALNNNVESLKARLEVVKMEEKREWYEIFKVLCYDREQR